MAASHINPNDRIFDWWNLQALPRLSAIHDLARKPGHSRALQYPAQPGDHGYPFPRWYDPRTLLYICFRWLHHLQSVIFVLENFFTVSS